MVNTKQFPASLLMLAISLIWASSSSALFTDNLSDKEISAAIESDLFIDSGVSSHLIDVTTKNGIVTLAGSVDNLLAKKRAVKIAQTIRGVRSVIDKISVVPIERTDDEIQKNIKRALSWDPATDSYEIEVEVNNGQVALIGDVDSWQEKQLASQVAIGVSGVKEVKNEMVINYKSVRPDVEIRADILRRLESDVWIYDSLIRVSVENGNVTLTGAVGSVAEKQRAGLLSWIAGVKKVDNSNLNVNAGIDDETKRENTVAFQSDDKIKAAIKEAHLYDSRVNAFNLNVEVDRGFVTLTGAVDNLKAKRSAEKNAKYTVGVWGVKNNLKVRPKDGPSDSEIAQNIRDALAFHPLVDRYDIGVIVRNKKVYLSGTVDSVFDKKRAEDVAARIAGVAEMDNRLMVNDSWPFKKDRQIKRDIEKEYLWTIYVDGQDIFVTVQNGKANLQGKVDSWNELQAAVRNAFEGGARTVETHFRMFDGSNEFYFHDHYGYEDLATWP
ncbi:MAG: hypothetical protein NPINA01_23130 [Nitrospinaceae bacterium]|nr:MAG: hypothetical protein NPINA01_23130 [Nitrospinaceae bacterium]